LHEIALMATKLDKINSSRSRLVVFTQGSKPTVVAFNGVVKEYPVIAIKSENIVDTTGKYSVIVKGPAMHL
jgi:adenosine kinase